MDVLRPLGRPLCLALIAAWLSIVTLATSLAVEVCWDDNSPIISGVVNPPYPGDGDWHTPENWRVDNNANQTAPPNNVVPGPGDRANIGLQNLTSEVEAPATITTGDAMVVSAIRLGTNPGLGVGGNGKLIIEGGSLTVQDIGTGDHFLIGADSNRTGHLIMTGGTLTVDDANRQLVLGAGANTATVGIVDFQGGTITANGGLYIAGDTNTADRKTTQGTFTMGAAGDSLTAQVLNTQGANLEVGRGGTGVFTQNSGTVTVGDFNLVVGQAADAVGTYNMNGGKLQTLGTGSYGSLRVGNTGNGTFNQDGGEVILSTVLDLGNADNAKCEGTYNLRDGALTVGGAMYVGRLRKGTFNFVDGTFNFGNTLFVGGTDTTGNGDAPSADGTVNIGDGSTTPVLNTAQFEVGRHAKGVVNQQSGTVHVIGANNLVLGQYSGSDGAYHLSGSASLVTLDQDLNVANRGKGTFTQDGGAVNVTKGTADRQHRRGARHRRPV